MSRTSINFFGLVFYLTWRGDVPRSFDHFPNGYAYFPERYALVQRGIAYFPKYMLISGKYMNYFIR
ncbi:hypothetical protein J2S13_002020 [Oikeobacillus pervagus]|uniref:Uncharacterized protein n=1 Tax=Oikeobacillus pervagus TaxID=1325931 RepID=A0AAJ1T2I3_9BACI|nr:hypothetical protein [Oikeobacillus pervagus]